MLQSKETQRESHILRGFERFEEMKQGNETERESCILRGFERFEALKHGVNHAFCEVLTTSKAFKHAQNLNLVSPPKMAPG